LFFKIDFQQEARRGKDREEKYRKIDGKRNVIQKLKLKTIC